MALNIEQAAKDAKGAVEYLKGVTGGPVGTTGFCMGGALSLFTACNEGDSVGACVDYYGGHPAVKYNWDGLTAPVLAFWAEHDDFVNPNIPTYEAEMKKRGIDYEAVQYPKTEHAFFNDTNPAGFNKEAADASWQKSLEFFRTHL
jgi:carboxymethylenebutenolidase